MKIIFLVGTHLVLVKFFDYLYDLCYYYHHTSYYTTQYQCLHFTIFQMYIL